MRFRLLLRFGIGASLLIGVAIPQAAVVSARPTSADWLRGVADSSEIAGDPVVVAHVRDAGGRPATGRAVLVAFPPPDKMSKVKVGGSVRLRPVGKATVDRGGRLALRIDPAITLRVLVSSLGTVDFEVLVEGPAGSGSFAFSRKIDAKTGRLASASHRRGVEPPEVTVDVKPRPAGTRATATQQLAAPPVYCTSTLKQVYSPSWVLIAELYTGPHATVDFTYAVGAQSTLGVGVSVSGSAGTFSQGGKITVGSSGSVNFAEVPQNQRRVEETQWRYGKWDVSCPMAPHFEARPHTWVGGSTYYNAAATPTAPYCTPYRAGDQPTIDQHQAVEWSNGVRISAIIGIDLSTTTGFTTKAAQQWTFTADGSLCGTNDYPFQARTTVGK